LGEGLAFVSAALPGRLEAGSASFAAVAALVVGWVFDVLAEHGTEAGLATVIVAVVVAEPVLAGGLAAVVIGTLVPAAVLVPVATAL
jgi:hypothetical protein